MLKKDKNLLYKAIEESGFPLTLFEYEEKDIYSRKSCVVIRFRNSELEFIIWKKPQNYTDYQYKSVDYFGYFYSQDWVESFPNYETSTDDGIPLEDVISAFVDWLNYSVKNYLDDQSVPDYWADFVSTRPFLSSTTFLEEDFNPFTSDEKVQIRQSLQEYRRLLFENIQTTHEQTEFINERLGYLGSVDICGKIGA